LGPAKPQAAEPASIVPLFYRTDKYRSSSQSVS
jgi:hypothetical protein